MHNDKQLTTGLSEKRSANPYIASGVVDSYPACKGANCGTTDGVNHSPECLAEHDETYHYREDGWYWIVPGNGQFLEVALWDGEGWLIVGDDRLWKDSQVKYIGSIIPKPINL